LPIDSSASITTEGLLGGTYIALTPGGETAMLKPGEEILETSGAADLMSLVGSVVNRSGGDAPAEAPAAPAQ
jgi:phospholipid/cholesterol/gamma-HCH transport system substrate-binding protein